MIQLVLLALAVAGLATFPARILGRFAGWAYDRLSQGPPRRRDDPPKPKGPP